MKHLAFLYDFFKFTLLAILFTMIGAWGIKNDPQSLTMTTNELMVAIKIIMVIWLAIAVTELAVDFWQDRKKKNTTQQEVVQ